MPNYFMPAKDPEEVRAFFADLVDQGKLKVVLATERPDVYNRITPTEEIRLVVDSADKTAPEGVDFDKTLAEFRPEPIAEDQLASWTDEILPSDATESEPPSDTETESVPAADDVVEIPHVPTENEVETDAELSPAAPPTESEAGVLDRKWTPFTSRGFKG